MKKLALHWKIIIGLFLGIIWAVLSGFFGWSEFTTNWLAPWGRIFINLLKLIAIPLVLFSIIGGIVGLGDPKHLGRMGIRTLVLYLSTTVIAVSLGLLIVNVAKPGTWMDETVRKENRIAYELWAQQEGEEVHDDINMLADPVNSDLIAEVAKRRGFDEDENVQSRLKQAESQKDSGPLTFIEDMVPDNVFKAMTDNGSMLKVIFFALFFGIALLFVPNDKAQPVIAVVNGLSEVFLKMVDLIMKGAPFFVFALMAGIVSEMAGDNPAKIFELFKGLTWYSLSVLGGLLLMAFVIYPTVMRVFVKRLSFKGFLKGISPAQMLAFSTSSSAATLPVTLECVEENLEVDPKVSSFVLPIGATVNMDGTSLYQAVAVIFLAQMHMIDLDLAQQLTIILTATLASIGSAAIPSAGLVMLMIVLSSVGLNPAWIGIILPVDRILDMVRTVVNVTGDATVATVIGEVSAGENEEVGVFND
ncbi:dicarboxylate/amino acid:cation symporter [Carboxylicivirga mesophila]|uniref:Dicarboxylate/amino acid:cation symporter n=1 Tax=Carboxylicivirga mesophila TaxID=1166478 RepID=A0ABS5K9N0_9BACT|nr:dicarboxylate/amino acid:cation symporter [Carboxylicivirga mesophila]MBS2211715.1 dicarboxylate/amino acid:cation symporter [Carboxylicivirga mesophila]